MKRVIGAISLVASLLAASATASGQGTRNEPAVRIYKAGWEAMHREAWAEAQRDFQQAIDIDPAFALAHYALGRARMGSHDFRKAIDAYITCRDLYLSAAGQHFTNQLDATKRLDDRILETRMAIEQAGQVSAAKSGAQSQNLMVRELQAELDRLTQAKDRNVSISIDATVPYFVPLALGSAYFRAGRLDDAERAYKAAVATDSKAGEALNNLAVVYLETGRFAEAETAIKAAKKAGFRVNPDLEQDIRNRRKGGE